MSRSHALLAILERAPAHGYTLKRRYDDSFASSKPLAFGQVYASLSRFGREGWAEVVEVETGEGPERKRYAITPNGVAILESWVYLPEPPDSFTASQLVAKVSVALLSGRSAETVLEQQRAIHLDRMRHLTIERRTTTEPTRLLAVTYQLAHLEADLRWIDEAGQRVTATAGQNQP
ncbi:MAG: PadR family transcriptional regulator [Nocardioidaceae bacterium]